MISLIPKTKNLIAYAGVALFFCVVSCASKGNRVGAMCEDGWKSNATGHEPAAIMEAWIIGFMSKEHDLFYEIF